MSKQTLETLLEFMYKYKIKLGRHWMSRKLDIENENEMEWTHWGITQEKGEPAKLYKNGALHEPEQDFSLSFWSKDLKKK